MPRRAAPHRGLDTHYGDAGDDDARPSKTQLKQQSHELQKLGRELAELSAAQLAAAPLDEGLREAIEMLRRTRTHEGRRRQLQYVGKLMRQSDADALREVVAAAQLGGARDALALHEAERWRAELIADDAALQRWVDEHPDCELQRLRSLVRAARRDAAALAAEQRQPKSFRELYQFIKPFIGKPAP